MTSIRREEGRRLLRPVVHHWEICQRDFRSWCTDSFDETKKKKESNRLLRHIPDPYLSQRRFTLFNFAMIKDEKNRICQQRFYIILNFATKMKKARAKSLNPWLSTNILRHVQFLIKNEKKAGKILESYLSTRFYIIFNFLTKMKKARAKSLNHICQ